MGHAAHKLPWMGDGMPIRCFKIVGAAALALPLLAGIGVNSRADTPQAVVRNWVTGPARSVLSLDGVWDVQPIRGLEFHFPPGQGTWQKEKVPHEASRFIETFRGPYIPTIKDLLNKEGTGFAHEDRMAAWFKRSFSMSLNQFAGKRAILTFKGAAFKSSAWLNGHLLGTSVQCAVPFEYDVTSALKPGTNELVVGILGREGIVDIAHKCYTTPCNGMMAGLWGSVQIELRPTVSIEDVYVQTAVKAHKVSVQVTVSNSEKADMSGTLSALIVDKSGMPQCTLGPVTISARGGHTGVVSLTRDWLAPHLWSPDFPELYTAIVSFKRGGKELDTLSTRFGYREFEIRGTDFYLNGFRTVLFRNSTLIHLGANNPAFPEIRSTVTRPYNCVRLHLGQGNINELDACDSFGMMAIPESSFSWTDVYPSAQKQYWLPNTLEFYRRWVRLHRNRPSVILWSLCNETYWDNRLPEDMAIADQIIATVKKEDAIRPLQGDGEASWDGRLPVTNVHYPEGDAGVFRTEFPNSGLVIPNDLWWIKDKGQNESWRAHFKMDRPLMLGEYWLMDGVPEMESSFAGDSAYDWELWKNPHSPRQIVKDTDTAALQKATDYYRLAGVACLNPWSGNRELFMRRIDVRPMDYYPNFAAGKTTSRKVAVFNDTPEGPTEPHLDCRLAIGGRTVWSGTVKVEMPVGSASVAEIPVACPALSAPATAQLTVRLREVHGFELARYEETIHILPVAHIAGVVPTDVLLLDSSGKTRKALATIGLILPEQALTSESLSKAKALIIGENTDASAYADTIRAWANDGGHVLQLRQEAGKSIGGLLPDIDAKHASSIAWIRSPDHPILAGLTEDQLRWWRPDHLLTRGTLQKPVTGRYRTILEAGGRYGMEWSPLAEIGAGKGLYVASQLLIADRIGIEPLAAEMLSRLVRYVAAASVQPHSPLQLLAGSNAKLRTTLQACSVVTADGVEGSGPLLLDASQQLTASQLAGIKSRLEAGGTLWLHRFTPETIAKLAGIIPAGVKLVPFDSKTKTAAVRQLHAWASGIASCDLYWAHGDMDTAQATAKLGDFVASLDVADAGQPLTAPEFLTHVPAAAGHILLDCLNWEDAYGPEPIHVTRLVSTLVNNLGGDIRPTVEPQYRYSNVDLSAYVNMGYYDKTAGDGKGGWTDQGENDMRFFLINHTGREGGKEGAPEIAVETWPSEVRFNGRPFRLTDPTKGEQKGVLVLRGKEHCAFLPGQVNGIKVGKKADKVWFLHTAGWAVTDQLNAEIGRYVMHYSDGTLAIFPLRYGIELQDWWNPAPLPGSEVAWTGRNLAHSPVGIWTSVWENPYPEKTIDSVDLVGDKTQTQIVLLGITLGIQEGGERAEKLVANWRFADFAGAEVPDRTGKTGVLHPGTPAPTVFRSPGHAGMHFTAGQSVFANEDAGKAIASGTPLTLEMTMMPERAPVGYMAGLFEWAQFGTSGFRLVYYQNMKLGVEIYSGAGKAAYLSGQTALTPGRYYRIQLRFDGQRAQLFLDGKLEASVDTPLPAACPVGFRLGAAAGKDYNLEGVIEEVSIRKPAH